MKRTMIALTAAVAVSGLDLSNVNAASAAKITSLTPETMIRGAVGGLTTDAMTCHDLDWLITQFPAANMREIIKSSSYSGDYGNRLDSRITQIRKQWKQKYGRDFSVPNSGSLFSDSFASIERGNADHDVRLKSEVLSASLQPSVNGKSSQIMPQGQAIAIMDVAANDGLPELKVPLVLDHGVQWTIRVPDTLSASRLRQNLLAELTTFSQNSAHWPASESQAYRHLAHRVLLAVMEKQAPTMHAFQPAAKSSQMASSTTPSHSWWKFWRNW